MSTPSYFFQIALRVKSSSNKSSFHNAGGLMSRITSTNTHSRCQQQQQRRWNGGNGRNGSIYNSSSSSSSDPNTSNFLQRFLGPKPMPPKNTPRWYAEMALVCTVFGITGTSTMFLVRPAVSNVLGLKGNFKDGPWSYRICSLVIMTPIYATLLVIVGTVFGRHAYFRHFSVKMFSRFGIPPELMDKNYHVNAKNFKKW